MKFIESLTECLYCLRVFASPFVLFLIAGLVLWLTQEQMGWLIGGIMLGVLSGGYFVYRVKRKRSCEEFMHHQ